MSTKNPRLHGLSCERSNVARLPHIPLIDQEGNIKNADLKTHNRYFHSVFPSCEGVSDDPKNSEKWDYKIHPQHMFVLEPRSDLDFILYTHQFVLDNENQTRNGEMIFNNVSSRMVRNLSYVNMNNLLLTGKMFPSKELAHAVFVVDIIVTQVDYLF